MFDSRINTLMKQLESLNYMPYQIQSILREAANGAQLDSITPTQADQIVKFLEDYIIFAQKCKKNKL